MSTPHHEGADLHGVAETLLIPLYGRAVETRKPAGLLADPKAVEMVEAIDYDFDRFDGSRSLFGSMLRTAIFDHWTSAFLDRHPAGTVVEVGTGLNTRFERLDNGAVHWVDLDLPEVITLRRRFFADTDRRHMIAASILDDTWVDQVRALPAPCFVAAEASILYLPEPDVLRALRLITDTVERGELAIDTWGRWVLTHQHKIDTLRGMDAPLSWACDDPTELSRAVPSLALRESRRFGDVPGPLRSRLPLAYRLLPPLLPRVSRPAGSYRLNLFDIRHDHAAPEQKETGHDVPLVPHGRRQGHE